MTKAPTAKLPPRKSQPSSAFGYTFPAIRGVQAGREYYVSMCPLRLIPKIFLFNEEELVPELRAQRVLNKARVPEIARYLLDNRADYTFSALTASIDGFAEFTPATGQELGLLGSLHVAMDARFVINDGQHRRAAIETAIRENSELADESIAVVFFVDVGLARCQQMFADLNRHAIRPSTSLGVLYDQRDYSGRAVKQWIISDPMFHPLTEMEKSTLAKRSRKLFTLSALYQASMSVMPALRVGNDEVSAARLAEFWTVVAEQFPAWQQVSTGELSSSMVRQHQLHSHALVLHAIARAGASLIGQHPRDWKKRLKGLQGIDWSRANGALWEGRAMLGGKVSKSGTQVALVTNAIKTALGVKLSSDEANLEAALVGTHVHG
ncbi:DNA sulfur modification protein DndB [Xanthomonas sp. WHRI 10064A]|uniref:DNA sulfur modification protein DndB n=1 Tax=unclassified Xanthomonas TaxID=2643310 RepID=UPI002B2238AD|nr:MULTISPECIES: DNA sulfur modification protein DndB [unclassified Xanthomonas]MEA9589199.1 DNA sulfur modification protein DndB [Xanthomonas sp. WHRI 10064B]MEA9616878.1 DNA sulfur modification protein DndB [Xanthomonas sp. WHRI 10064A]